MPQLQEEWHLKNIQKPSQIVAPRAPRQFAQPHHKAVISNGGKQGLDKPASCLPKNTPKLDVSLRHPKISHTHMYVYIYIYMFISQLQPSDVPRVPGRTQPLLSLRPTPHGALVQALLLPSVSLPSSPSPSGAERAVPVARKTPGPWCGLGGSPGPGWVDDLPNGVGTPGRSPGS